MTSSEDRQWLYVGGSRGIGKTTFYSVVSPEPAIRSRDPEREALDVPAADRTPKQQADQLTMVARRDGSKQLATDTTEVVDGRSMSKHDLRAELRRFGHLIDQAPRDQSRLLAHATTQREQYEQRLTEATGRMEQARDLLAGLERGPARWLRRGDLARAREQSKQAEEAYQVAQQAANRAADRERAARQAQQQHQAHREANPDLLDRRRELLRVQAWRQRAEARAVELEQPAWSRDLGERPATVKAGRAWDRAVEQTVEYRQRWNIADGERALGPEPHGTDASLEQRRAWWHASQAVGSFRDLATDRAARSDRQEATGRSDHRGDHGRPDHRGHERDHDHERAM